MKRYLRLKRAAAGSYIVMEDKGTILLTPYDYVGLDVLEMTSVVLSVNGCLSTVTSDIVQLAVQGESGTWSLEEFKAFTDWELLDGEATVNGFLGVLSPDQFFATDDGDRCHIHLCVDTDRNMLFGMYDGKFIRVKMGDNAEKWDTIPVTSKRSTTSDWVEGCTFLQPHAAYTFGIGARYLSDKNIFYNMTLTVMDNLDPNITYRFFGNVVNNGDCVGSIRYNQVPHLVILRAGWVISDVLEVECPAPDTAIPNFCIDVDGNLTEEYKSLQDAWGRIRIPLKMGVRIEIVNNHDAFRDIPSDGGNANMIELVWYMFDNTSIS